MSGRISTKSVEVIYNFNNCAISSVFSVAQLVFFANPNDQSIAGPCWMGLGRIEREEIESHCAALTAEAPSSVQLSSNTTTSIQ
jgi:hypothetical protein